MAQAHHMTRQMRVRDAVTDLLQQAGVTRIFGNPGSTELPLFTDLPQGLSYHLALHEGIAVAMADGYAQAARGLGVVNLHSAAGIGNAMGGIYTAFRNETPLLLIAGQQSRALVAQGAYLSNNDSRQIAAPYVKQAYETLRAEDVPAAMAEAIQLALTAPMGPVLVSVPVDDWDRMAPCAQLRRAHVTPHPDPAAVSELADALVCARNLAIVAGAGVDRSAGGWDALSVLARHLQAPVFSAPTASRMSFGESSPLFAGHLPSQEPRLSQALQGHDVILVLGAPAFTLHFEGPPTDLGTAKILQIAANPAHLSRGLAQVAVLGDVAAALRLLLDRIGPPRAPATPQRAAPEFPTADRLTQEFATATLARMVGRDIVLCDEAPTNRPNVMKHLPITRSGSYFFTASGGLGFALPAAVGVAMALRDRPVVATVGDGSALYAIQSLWSGVDAGVDLLVMVFNNGGYRVLEGIARMAGAQSVSACTITHLDFCAMAQGQGATARRVTEAHDLVPTLTELLPQRGVRLIEVMVAT